MYEVINKIESIDLICYIQIDKIGKAVMLKTV